MSAGLRVAHVICSDGFAGAERYLLTAAVEQARAGCRVVVIGGAEATMRPALAAAGVHWRRGDSPRQALAALWRLGRPDVINTHMTEADAVGALVGAVLRVPVVSTRHFAAPRGSSAPARMLARGIRRGVAAQLSISDFVRGTVDGPSTTVLSGVEPAPEVTEPRERVVLVAQRLEDEKDTAVALEAWARVGADASTGWRLAIAGRGALREQLELRARELGIADTVDFLGYRDDVERLFRSASLLLATAPAEPLGLSVVEAMSHGLPVVAASGGGHLETVGAVPDAALFTPGDADAAAAQLARLMGDAAERDRYGAALRAHQRTVLSAQRQTEETLRLYRGVVAARRR